MGRGRAKAKQTKVARELKYSTGNLDPDRLRAELAGSGSPTPSSKILDDDVDPYAVDEDDDEDSAPAEFCSTACPDPGPGAQA